MAGQTTALQLAPLSIKTGRMAWPMVDAMPLELKATLQQQTGSGAQGTLVAQGVASPRDATLDITLSDLALETLAPYLAQLLTPRVEGHLSAHAKVDWSANADAPRLRVDLDQAALESLRMRPSRASADRDGVSLARLSLAGVQVDLAGRRATIGEGKLAQPFVMLARDGQGSWNVVRWLQPALGRAEASGAPPAQAKPSVPADKAQPWQVEVHAFSLEGGRLRLVTPEGASIAEVTMAGRLRFVRLGNLDFVFEREVVARRGAGAGEGGSPGTLEAPMPGVVTRVLASPGDEVHKGQPLVVLEAMKMEHQIRAPRAGRVRSVLAEPGQMVAGGATLVELEPEADRP